MIRGIGFVIEISPNALTVSIVESVDFAVISVEVVVWIVLFLHMDYLPRAESILVIINISSAVKD